ncbi:MAG TPA: thiamine-phosphate kinase [Rhizomicrobium sp.]|nr:thiamine-phosphate kinase [Rhizomicrobium sp.]
MARQADSPLSWGEFELIDRIFAPLAHGFSGAFDLKDDVAVLEPRAGHELVLKTDSTIEGVHFLSGDPPETVARKALRRALSDIAAKGATPAAYLLAVALPASISIAWIEKFAEGLRGDQAWFRVALAGGETNRTPGALTITVMAVGWVPSGRLLRRNGAKAGDHVWVTGTVGDAGAGLSLLKKEAALEDIAARDRLVERFRVPEPRMEFGKALGGVANAAIDVSDGLIADLDHLVEASGIRVEIDLDRVPISPELRALWGHNAGMRAVSAGDDYEIAFTAPASAVDEIAAAASRTRTPVTCIGSVIDGSAGVRVLDSFGCELELPRKGYRHF